MSREQQDYHGSVRAWVIAGFGLSGLVLTVLTLLLDEFSVRRLPSSLLLGICGGFPIGCTIGALVAWLVVSESVGDVERPMSAGPQLVGQFCVMCRKQISSILEAEFCSVCRAPIHHRCIREPAEELTDILSALWLRAA